MDFYGIKKFCFHLIRNLRPNEEKISLSVSTSIKFIFKSLNKGYVGYRICSMIVRTFLQNAVLFKY